MPSVFVQNPWTIINPNTGNHLGAGMKSTLKERLANLVSTRSRRLSDFDMWRIYGSVVIVLYVIAIWIGDS